MQWGAREVVLREDPGEKGVRMFSKMRTSDSPANAPRLGRSVRSNKSDRQRGAWPAVMLSAVLATLLVALPLAGCSDSPTTVVAPGTAGVLPPANTITVVGEGKVTSLPDEAVITLSVESDGKNPAAAMNKNSAAVVDVIERLKNEGVDEADIETANISLYPIRTYTNEGQERLTGYRATNSVRVTVSDAKQVGEILSAAIEAGANNVSGPVWQLSDDAKAVAEALKKAVENARQKAEALASSVGADLGDVVMVSESNVQVPVYPMYAESYVDKSLAAGDVAETPVMAASLDVTATITVTFALKR